MPSWTRPTDPQIEAALQRLRSPEFEAYFFGRLENPEWVLPLHQRGVFATPPKALPAASGGWTFPVWPASRYLVRMAAHVPAQVAAILSTVESENPYVLGDVVEAAMTMPAQEAAAVVPVLAKAAQSGALTFHFGDATSLCERLLKDGESSSAMALAEGLFSPVLDDGQETLNQRDQYWYKEGLDRLVPLLAGAEPRAFVPRLCAWLEAAIRAKPHVSAKGEEDYSFIWRQAIEEHEQNTDSDLAGSLVGATREAFEVAVREGGISLDDALASLGSRQYVVFKRLRLHLMTTFAERAPELARGMMLDRHLFDDPHFKHEYARLMGARFGLLSGEEQAEWLRWALEGPDAAELEDLEDESDRKARSAYWSFSHLHWVREHLTGAELEFYEAMLAEHGEPRLADLHMYTSAGAWGTPSPKSVEELSALSFDDAVDTVATWQPDSKHPLGPDVEGLASTFGEYLKTSPNAFSSSAGALIARPAIYVRTFLNVMAEEVKEGRDIDVDRVLALSEWVVSRPPDERTTYAAHGHSLVDKDWQWTRDAIARLLEGICNAKDGNAPKYPQSGLRERIWSLLSELLHDPSASYLGDDQAPLDPRAKDYLTPAINSPRGKAMEAAFAYARWVANHLKQPTEQGDAVPDGFASLPEVRDMLDWQVAEENRSFEALAIVGINLGWLYWMDPKWLAEHVDSLFDLEGLHAVPARPHGWAAWNAFLVWVRPHVVFYELFRGQFLYAIRQSADVELESLTREDPMGHLGEHLAVLLGRGHLTTPADHEVLREFLEHAHPHVRRHAMGFIGRVLWREEQLPEEMVQRFMDLWEEYWAGSGPDDARSDASAWLFGPWFASDQLPTQWALQQLATYVEVVPLPEPDRAVVLRLAAAAKTDVLCTVQILDRMIRADREGWHVHMWREPAQEILRLALESDAAARTQAAATIDYLGRRGYPDFI